MTSLQSTVPAVPGIVKSGYAPGRTPDRHNLPMPEQTSLSVRSGPWDATAIGRFLDRTAIPLRLASNGSAFPLVQSLWFAYDPGILWCCTQADSVVARRLGADERCAFEVSGDSPPYRGVRGTGRARLARDGVDQLLPRLIDRYLGSTTSPLADWLMSRLESEVAIAITSLSVTSWDYGARMSAP